MMSLTILPKLKKIHDKILTSDIEPSLIFVRARNRKKERVYYLYQAQLDVQVSKKFGNWLKSNIKSAIELKKSSSPGYNKIFEVDMTKYSQNWTHFKDTFSDLKDLDGSNIKELRKGKDLKGYLVNFNVDNMKIGYFRYHTVSQTLSKSGMYRLHWGKGSYNKLKKDKGLDVDPFFDFLYLIDSTDEVCLVKEGFSNDKFELIFDIRETDIKEIKKITGKSPIFSFISGTTKAEIEKKILKNGNYRRVALSAGAKDGWIDASFSLFSEVKTLLGDELKIELDRTNKKAIMDESTESIKSLLRVISYRDRRTLDNKHIYSGSAESKIM